MPSPRGSNTYKRPEEPPRNSKGKMICKFDECRDLVFDRKCEWGKHMDKHDRPYKCKLPGCEKLLGFTYSGGLLRHKREVHKMNAGTKRELFCNVPNCKRNSGTGFTRKENLAEHMRRVHRRTSASTDAGSPTVRRGESVESDEMTKSPSCDAEEEADVTQRSEAASDHVDPDLREEVRQLKQMNKELLARVGTLEEFVSQQSRQQQTT
ncbi:hypothetical protein K402DRAFT_340339 [Aulographum hederae CBS 113979]|uniref:C2H2-type domain-containing protein n=1 Tax=Aulographum hederae CBS 113979 TaxID=1176131 RepID=A0A6G1GNC6_9PEZI|nr:hypothetical protein K402DRAFT_340339 [Aulographum hederae CBS 113979]